jgi:hypothetical protein
MTFDYKKMQRDRLVDLIGEYLNDDEVTAEEFYNIILEEVQSWVNYNQKNLEKSLELYLKLQGQSKEKV